MLKFKRMSANKKRFKGKNIVITGGDGFIGQALLKQLKAEGANIATLDIKTGFDICNWQKMAAFKRFKKIDLVYHLAAINYVPDAWENPRRTFDINLKSTLNILEFCRLKRVGHLVFQSSYVYGRPKYLPIDESHPVGPTNPYSWSKLAGETLCEAYARDYGIAVTILRPFNVYGVGQRKDFLVPLIIDQAWKSNNIHLNDLKPKRDFLYLDDMVEALVLAGKHKTKSMEVFNIGSGESYSIAEIVAEVARAAGKELMTFSRKHHRCGEIMDLYADISKAKRSLKWQPKVKLTEGLALVWNAKQDIV